MMMRLLHAAAAVLTAILCFIRHRYAIMLCPSKRWRLPSCPSSYGDTSLTNVSLMPDDCAECARAATCFYDECGLPKYKRDPDISIDNENIGQHPHD